MPIPTIVDLTPDQLVKLEFEKARKKTVTGIVLEPDALLFLLLVRVSPSVTPDKHEALRLAMKALSDVEEVEQVVNHPTWPTSRLPDGLRQEATVTLNIELKKIPIPEPE